MDADVNFYTDGSKQKKNQSGAGLCAYEVIEGDNRKFESWIVPANRCFYLEDQNIFACEVFAVRKAAELILNSENPERMNSANINIDSLACILALKKSTK